MLLKVTMVFLLILPSPSLSNIDGFNNTNLRYPTWSIDNCTDMFASSNDTCKITEKDACKICNGTNCTIHVAVLFPDSDKYIVNLNRVKTTLEAAVSNVSAYNFEFHYMDDGCSGATVSTDIILIYDWCPHVFFACICDYALANAARVAKLLGNSGAPLLSPSGFTYDFTSVKKVVMEDEFYHLINIGSAGYASLGEFLHLVADRYGWTRFALMYEKNELSELAGELVCNLLMTTIANEFAGSKFDYQSGDLQLLNTSYDTFLKEKIGVNYAIVLTCASHENIRKIAINAAKLGMMDKKEYVFINFALHNSAQEPDRPWYDANDMENNELAKIGFSSFLTFYPYREAEFEKVAKQEFRGSFYLQDVHDSMTVYSQSINNMIANQSIDSIRGCDIVQYMMGNTFQDVNGEEIIINCNGQRVADYALVAQDEYGISKIIGTYTTKDRSITFWDPGNFTFPPDTPECGFDLSKCPTYDKVNILLISLISVIFIGLLAVAIVIYRHYKLKADIYSEAWKVSYDDIAFLSKDRRSSIHSILPLKELDEMSLAGDTQLFAQIGYYKSIRVAIKKLPEVKLNLSHKQLYELKVMKDLSNDNLVKFYGACIDIPNNCLLIEYCPRGSLQDILENPQYNLDWAFRMSLIMDVARGMNYLHDSHIKSHGALKSSNCLVDSRFVLKISDFGLHFLRTNDKNDDSNENSYEYWKPFLWTAPELLRTANPSPAGSQKGDVYSFAIIMEEIIMREGAFFIKGSMLEPKGRVPRKLKTSVMVPIPKVSTPKGPADCTPINLLPVVDKIIETTVCRSL